MSALPARLEALMRQDAPAVGSTAQPVPLEAIMHGATTLPILAGVAWVRTAAHACWPNPTPRWEEFISDTAALSLPEISACGITYRRCLAESTPRTSSR